MVFQLACFDMDGTLIRNTNSVRYLCCLNGKEPEALEIEDMEDTGRITWIESDYLKAKLLKGLRIDRVISEFDEKVKLISGIEEVMRYLNQSRIKTVLVTAGPIQVAGIMKDKFNFDTAYGSNYEVIDGCFTGKILGHLGEGGKLKSLVSFCAKNGIDLRRTLAIGDSSSDIEIFRECGKSIAINYSDALTGKASVYLRTDTLTDILKHLL